MSELLGASRPANDVQLAVKQGAAGLEEARAWVCTFLPEELCGHVSHALERGGELTVFTESAAWAGRLTLALAELRNELAPRLPVEARLVVRVVPGGRYRR